MATVLTSPNSVMRALPRCTASRPSTSLVSGSVRVRPGRNTLQAEPSSHVRPWVLARAAQLFAGIGSGEGAAGTGHVPVRGAVPEQALGERLVAAGEHDPVLLGGHRHRRAFELTLAHLQRLVQEGPDGLHRYR